MKSNIEVHYCSKKFIEINEISIIFDINYYVIIDINIQFRFCIDVFTFLLSKTSKQQDQHEVKRRDEITGFENKKNTMSTGKCERFSHLDHETASKVYRR